MKAMRLIAVAAVLVAGASFGTARVAKPVAPPSLKDQMIGVWRLQSRTIKHADGSVVDDPNFGADPVGYIWYGSDGFMSVQFMKRDRAKDAGATGYIAYFGPYTVDEKAKTVTHHVEGDLNPGGVSQENLRYVQLEGDKLTLTVRNANSPNENMNNFVRMK